MIKSTFSILFLVRKSRQGKGGETAITMRITVNGRFTEMNTLRKVPLSLWEQKKERAIGKGPIPIEINRHLESLRTRAYEIHKELVERDGYADPLTIKEYLQGKHISQKMFYATFEEHNERMAQLVGIEYDRTTLARYRLCLRYFKEMVSRKTKVADIPIKNLNGEMIRNFETFLKIEKHVAHNTMIRYMKCLKKVTNLALANGWISINPFAGIKFSEKKVVKDFLTIEEVNTIRTKEFGIERLDMVRDIFIFCCYTGLAFIDVYNLKPEHITEDAHGRKWIHKQRQKTDVEFFVPLLEYPLSLIEKYRNHPMCRANGTIFPVYANQKMNSYLKEIADFCGIKKHLTMHTARYTFATTITLANNVKLENVSKMLGHTNTRMTLHYAHIMNESLAQEMNKVAAIMGEIENTIPSQWRRLHDLRCCVLGGESHRGDGGFGERPQDRCPSHRFWW